MQFKSTFKQMISSVVVGIMFLSVLLGSMPVQAETQDPAASVPDNLLVNASFEDGDLSTIADDQNESKAGNWFAYKNTERVQNNARTGEYAARLYGSGASLEQDIEEADMVYGKSYTYSAWIKKSGYSTVYFGLKNYGGEEIKVRIENSDEYQYHEIKFVYTGNGSNPRAYVWAESRITGSTYVDDTVVQMDPDGGEITTAQIESVSAVNGTITAILDKDPTQAPVLTDFKVEYSIDDAEFAVLAMNGFSYDREKKELIFRHNRFDVTEEDQKVRLKITWQDDTTEYAYTLAGRSADAAAYYIDAGGGSDSNDGLTPETAWQSIDRINAHLFQPGDQILFKTGESWTGELMPQGSGEAGAPIVIASYGDGPKPVLMPGEDRREELYMVANEIYRNLNVNNVICFNNQEHWEVRDLELYDPDFEENKFENYNASINTATDVYRRGINLRAKDYGDMHGFTFDNLTIHGFRGPSYNRGKASGGIIMTILSDPDNKENQIPTGIHDISITNCEMYDLGRSGLNFTSPWTTRQNDDDNWGSFGYKGIGEWYPCKNIYIANNIIHDIDGDGILIDGCKNTVVEHNVVYRTAMHSLMAVGIFNWNSDDTYIQFNEVYDVMPADATGNDGDSQGIEIDALNRDTYVQYNYMHNNRGGVFMWCCTSTLRGFRGIYRYNISQNDGATNGIIRWEPNHIDSMAYNNTVYITGTASGSFISRKMLNTANGTKFYNNIFYNTNPNLKTASGLGGLLETQIDWKNNIFYGMPAVPADSSNLNVDPLFAAPELGAAGLQLQESSPAIDAGLTIDENGGRDYFGNPLADGMTDIGAAEYVKTEPVNPAREALRELVEDLTELKEENYTSESWASFNTALQAAQDVLANTGATDSELNRAYLNLVAARIALVDYTPASTAELEAYIKAALDADTTNIRPGKLAALNTALAEAQAVMAKEQPSQEEVNAAADKLLEALINLKEIVDKTDLSELLALLKSLDKNRYTAESWAVLQGAIDHAATIDDDSGVAEVENAYRELQNAFRQLKEKPVVNKDALKNALDNAAFILDNIDLFISATTEGLKEIYGQAVLVYNNPDATQDDIDAITEALAAANAKARVKEDKTALKEIIEKAKTYKASEYTAGSYALLQEAFTAAEAVYNDELADREQIEAAVNRVKQAIQQLEKKSAPLPEDKGKNDKPRGNTDNDSGSGSVKANGSTRPGNQSSAKAAATGDHTSSSVFLILMGAAILCGAVSVRHKRRKNN